MSTFLIAVLVVVAVVEVLAGFVLLFVWDDLKQDRVWIDQAQRKCFACVTGASVTSFKNNHNFCYKHLAHWVLIHDLEEKTRKELG